MKGLTSKTLTSNGSQPFLIAVYFRGKKPMKNGPLPLNRYQFIVIA
jgi:hypothetical protein